MSEKEPQGKVDTFVLLKWFLIAALTIGAFALLVWFALDAIFKYGESFS
jgi:hypothetical protein